MTSQRAFLLATTWHPATENEPLSYSLTLTNLSNEPISDFRLCVSGPGRIDASSTVEGGTLAAKLSNHSQLAPPDGFVLQPKSSWTITARGLSYPLRHWTDGANAAYLALVDGSTAMVAVEATRSAGDNGPLKRGAEIYPVPAHVEVPLSVVPWPHTVAISGRRAVPQGLALLPEGDDADAVAKTFGGLVQALFPVEGIARSVAEGGLPVKIAIADGFKPEAYAIRFSSDPVHLSASTRSGLLYGLITLGQILRGARHYPQTFLFPLEGEIRDEPSMRWRGTHLDVARQFYGSAEISQFLHILAWNKLNRFHWHLSDDEAWRVEIDAYPELVSVGAWRGHGLPIPPLLGSGPQPTGGYYTKTAVREIVALAGDLGIDVVPEIDMPGHCYAVLQSLPWLRDPQETGAYFSIQDFPNNCLNPARDETYEFVETLLDELLELFPSQTIHVGADEVPADAWTGSPQAKARLAELGGDTSAVLQADFLRRVQASLTARGRMTGAWQEAAVGGGIDKAHCYLNGWHTVEICAELATEGYDIVVCPGQVYYLDMANSPDWSEPGAGWAGWSEPEKLYNFDPVEGWSTTQKKRFLGVQTCIWSEPMTDRGVFDRLVFPRISALAETGWTQPEAKSWERFKALAGLMPVLYGSTAPPF
ncbi:beta-N-acetylhexosaminidase (plasmid) [Phyllobacterium sp. 628]|uniref:beta-N-acetylhexosaminidase n=1 Tax=Phyllobacterium sp. 628 TaxID=2718938 RepID=UPI0016624F4F|nr:beta-N-acetylhexosaminidase [Phyllobacterium sp. 628]QND55020.1 beta-N-acetylhexosaminidase [Phyllobacterium sp. 628]